jgi:hypothetical protein
MRGGTQFLENPFEFDFVHTFTGTNLQSEQQDDDTESVTPPYKITFESIMHNVLPIKSVTQRIDVRHMNAYQIIRIMYTLLAWLKGVLCKSILNQKDIKRTIKYVARYCFATRSAPFNTMHAPCTEYNIRCLNYLNNCEGDDEAIPVTATLFSMCNACYAFQNDKRENLLILALQRLDHGREAISDKAFVRTFSEYKNIFHL